MMHGHWAAWRCNPNTRCAWLAGDKLERAAALATPQHSYVPWILVDGVPLGEGLLLWL